MFKLPKSDELESSLLSLLGTGEENLFENMIDEKKS